jgi:hypothetical protein
MNLAEASGKMIVGQWLAFGHEPYPFPHAICSTIAINFAAEQDDFSSNRHPAPSSCLRMIFSENRFPLFRLML